LYLSNLFSKWDLRFLELAKHISEWSKDKTKVGAVLSKGKEVVKVGFNGLPKSVRDEETILQNRDLKLKLILHAEENILARAHEDITDYQITTYPILPCSKCASQLIQRGITKVVAPVCKIDRWQESIELGKSIMLEAGVDIFEIEQI